MHLVIGLGPIGGKIGAHLAGLGRKMYGNDFNADRVREWSEETKGFALDLARQADVRVTLLHVVEWLAEEAPRSSTHFNVPEYRRYMVEDAQERTEAGGRRVADLGRD